MARTAEITFKEFRRRYNTEDACRAELFRLRFPNGFVCPKCGCVEYYPVHGRNIFQCRSCQHQTSVTAGTVMVRATGLEPARFWQWNLNPPSLPIPPCPLISAGCAAVCFPSGLPGYLNTNISHCQSDSFFFFRSLFCQFCPEKTACMGFYTVYLPFYP